MSSLVLVTGAKGLAVRFTARSEEKAQKVLSRPVAQSLEAEDRLSHVLIPNVSVEGAYKETLKGVSAGGRKPTDFSTEDTNPQAHCITSSIIATRAVVDTAAQYLRSLGKGLA
ncbi:hypothetical protein PHISCL_01522 [Aspergillus sclerotialis]|uniref:Uncharacterized protein n=1 Tax=Aspergillus sclerotialis TaxID=2070753 RepID=A0A3A2ZSP8_9EURO|nr:hypothetical protein PHISCL_01522 [Aspergillus sclerotialis]